MLRFLSILFLISAPVFITKAQPAIEWQYSIGGTLADQVDNGNRVTNNMVLTNDNGFIIAGHSYSNDGDVSGHHGLSSNADFWVVKLDSLGGIEWERSLGGSASDIARCVKVTSDGGYIVIGESFSVDGDVSSHFGGVDTNDAWVVKLDASGSVEWEHSYGGTEYDLGAHILEVAGGYVFIGDTRSTDGDVSVSKGLTDIWVVKIDTVGNIIWEKSYGGSGSERPDVIRQTSDGGFIFTGFTTSSDGDVSNNQHPGFLWDLWIVKIDVSGSIQWEKTYGGSLFDYGGDVMEIQNGEYVVIGKSASTDDDVACNTAGSNTVWILRLDSNGSIVLNTCLGGSGSDEGKTIRQTPDGGFLIGARTQSIDGDVSGNNGEADCWIIKTDSLFNIEWEKAFGGSDFEGITTAIITPDGGIAFAGQSLSNDGDVSGHHGSLSENDIWVVKLSPVLTGLSESETNIKSLKVSPNPVVDQALLQFEMLEQVHVQIDLLDISGRVVKSIGSNELNAGIHQLEINTTDLDNGMYLVRLSTAENVQTVRIIKNY